jgi:DNA-binding MurR/RpiR family transcriptional regulator
LKLNRKKEKGIAALISSPSIQEAAKVVGVGEATIYRWLKDPGFEKSYQQARRQVVTQVIAQVQANMSTAVQTLKEIMENKKAPASARVSAAKEIIATSIKAVEIEDLEQRISQIEKIIEDQRHES